MTARDVLEAFGRVARRDLRTARQMSWLLLAVATLFVCLTCAVAQARDQIRLPGSDLEDPVEPLTPERPRTEAEQDRLQAAALYAAARTAEQKGDNAAALRLFERAHRYDPNSVAILRQIVPLAFSLERHAEAVRYALMVAEKEPADQALLRRLANYLTEEGEWKRALKLYERALEMQRAAKPSGGTVLIWMEMGRLSYLTKDFEGAARRFADVLKALAHPADYALDDTLRKAMLGDAELTYQLFGETFLEARRFDEAIAAFQKSHESKANEPLLAYNLARVYARQKRYSEALAQLEKYAAAHNSEQGTGPYELLCDVLKELGHSERLLGRLEVLRREDPANQALAYVLARRYQKADRLTDAEGIYKSLLKDREHPPVEAYRGLVEIYRKTKQPEALLGVVGDAVTKAGSLAPLGDELKLLVADKAAVDALLDNAAKRKQADPASLDYGTRLAVALLATEAKRYDVAETFYSLALESDPSRKAELLLGWGLELFMADRFAESVKVLNRGIDEKALPDDNPAFHFYLAGALEMTGQTDEAVRSARHAAGLQKDSARLAARIPWVLYHAKRYDEARRSYEELISKFGEVYESPETREALRDARLVLSNIAVVQKDIPRAEEWLEQILDEFPDDAGAMNDLGYLWADSNKRLNRALAMIERAVAAEPDNPAYRDSLGWAYYRLGRYPEAVEQLKLAAAVDSPDAVILEHLGDALEKLGDAQAALTARNRAVEAFQRDGDKAKADALRERIARSQQQSASTPAR